MKQLIYLFLTVCLSVTLAACSGQTMESKSEVEPVAKTEHGEETPSWSYEGETDPKYWGELDPSYASCVDGREQSPINIEFSQVKASETVEHLDIQYESTVFSVVNNGHTVQANTELESNKISIGGKEYTLRQFHFHTPSEHQFNGQQYDMELHLVHQNENGELAVLGMMIQEGNKNELLQTVWDVLPEEKTEEAITVNDSIDLKKLLPQNETFFYYNGSLTTPPCTEGVQWMIFEEPIEMSKEQIEAFQQIFPDNHRPVQPLNEREVLKN